MGIDKSSAFIQMAADKFSKPSLQFHCCDFSEVSGGYDFVIMRLFLQHIADLEGAFEKLQELTRRGSGILIVDAYDEMRYFHPDVPEFMKFFQPIRNLN